VRKQDLLGLKVTAA